MHNAAQKGETVNVNDMAASFQNTISDILVDKAMLAAKDLGYTTIGLAGGVSANSGGKREASKKPATSVAISFICLSSNTAVTTVHDSLVRDILTILQADEQTKP